MKHLTLALESHNENVAMEGFLDNIQTSFHALKSRVFSHAPDAEKELKKQDQRVAAILAKLIELKAMIEKSSITTSQEVELGKLLHGLDLRSAAPEEVLAALKRIADTNTVKINKAMALAKRMQEALSKKTAPSPGDQQAVAQLTAAPADKPAPSGTVKFNKKQLIILVEIAIGQCKQYQEARAREFLMEHVHASEAVQEETAMDLLHQLTKEFFGILEHLFRIATIALKLVFKALKLVGGFMVAGMDFIVAFFEDMSAAPSTVNVGYRQG